ncbi:MAG: histidine phosphatase family protein [Candidatus Thioglobus sp.]|jgi:phosphohistidine phosphatase SixA
MKNIVLMLGFAKSLEEARMLQKFMAVFLSLFLALSNAVRAEANNISDAITAIGANVIFMRHALAPGFGDPVNFDIADCTSQRNLDNNGVEQAISIGKALKMSGAKFNTVFTSEWCRCQQTAVLLNIGKPIVFGGLNSFFQQHAPREKTLQQLNDKLSEFKLGELNVLVTHQVTIQAVTGLNVSSGGMVAFNTVTKQTLVISEN